MTIHLGIVVGIDKVKPCPFCGKYSITLNNTHTASYWMACETCGAEVHGEAFEVPKRTTRAGRGGSVTAKESLAQLEAHQKAKDSALKAWNRRN